MNLRQSLIAAALVGSADFVTRNYAPTIFSAKVSPEMEKKRIAERDRMIDEIVGNATRIADAAIKRINVGG